VVNVGSMFFTLRDVKLSEAEAMALAQFVKRVSFSACREHAVDDNEARLMIDAFEEIRRDLALSGFAPR